MLKINIQHNHEDALNFICGVNNQSVKSNHFYNGYIDWFRNTFMMQFKEGKASIITAHCKTYNTLIGFGLIKHDTETKISNLSPLVDGVGVTQCLLDSCDFILTKDYDIFIPEQAIELIQKVKTLGFHFVEENLSNDLTKQLKFSKPRNITWI